MTSLFRFLLLTAATYLGGSLGFVLGESSVYVGGKIADEAGAPIPIAQVLPHLLGTPFINGGFALFLIPYAAFTTLVALWVCRWSWFDGAGLLGIMVLSVGSGFVVGLTCCLASFLCFGGWSAPFPLLYIGAATAAIFCSALLDRRPIQENVRYGKYRFSVRRHTSQDNG